MDKEQQVALTDHDLLVSLTVTVNNLRDEIKISNANRDTRFLDIETRMRAVEKDNEQLRGSRDIMRWMIGLATASGPATILVYFLSNGK